VPIGFTSFELLPFLSTACDLYSLAVLAVRTLLVDSQTTLAVALDETLSLAKQLAYEHNEAEPITKRIQAIFDKDKRWVASLGPHRLVHDSVTTDEAFDSVPPTLWFGALAVILRMFPGIGPESICRDYGDGPPDAMHQVFDQTLEELQSLLVRTRSLIVIDWKHNREIHQVIRSQLFSLESIKSPPATSEPDKAPAAAAPAPTAAPTPAAGARGAAAAPAPTLAPPPPTMPPPQRPAAAPAPARGGGGTPAPANGGAPGAKPDKAQKPAPAPAPAPAPKAAPKRQQPPAQQAPQPSPQQQPPGKQPAPRQQPVRLPWTDP
jgi:hypothetical protein